ncbi:hypothetical protein GCM10010329_45890 [Streptomyces spiroverticillatus]|uniref:DUF2267 domain-containing protein n=1 Tax=Streptomyces finlayi TaxID=67296 RepID=A0A918WZU2_9ACTN|nr:DUF2267 domain-containing protein [Streptomyces finlayi]GHA17640.1 hypothetical protein GCM10010329_45890 [Streptomyces spiroverticillatus]GHC99470.1 hypothetical protein GCM10010334_43060 [Streptomyces finlayi]
MTATTTPGRPHAYDAAPREHSADFREFVSRVQADGLYRSAEYAGEVVRTVLEGLGAQVTGDERVELAGLLPREAAEAFVSRAPGLRPLSGFGFVQDLAARRGTGPGPARWDAGSVLRQVARVAGPDLTGRILAGLPEGYALLFGVAQLVRRNRVPVG